MPRKEKTTAKVIQLKFDDNNLARNLFGPQELHLKSLRDRLGVDINVRGGEVSIQGERGQIEFVQNVLTQLYGLLKKGYPILGSDVDRAVRILSDNEKASLHDIFLDSIFIPARKKIISPRSPGQKLYVAAIRNNDLTFGVGPAGTGKTYLAVAMAVTHLLKGDVRRIVLTRPAVEAGEKLGFLPGDLAEKVNPYLRPLYDALNDMLDYEKIELMLARDEIEVAPLAFMRGRTLSDAFVILDEAQNCTLEQMKMFLTRIGMNSRVVVTGDVTQSDLPADKKPGLVHALEILSDIPGIACQRLTEKDVVRHPLVTEILKAYDRQGG